MSKKVAIIGLDCSSPELVFESWIDELPTIKALKENGLYGRLKSTMPPITVPAWMSMMTSKDPGTLGFYGFRNRKDYSYKNLSFATSSLLKHKTAWDILGEHDKKSIVLGVPMTYPPKKINGIMVGCFMTPDINSTYTYPESTADEIKSWVGDYMVDVPNFRTENKKELLDGIYRMTEKRFEVAKHLVREKEWDFFMMVEMGPDRIQHAFWAYEDETHPKHDPNSPFVGAIKKYHTYVDEKIGELMELFPDNTTVMLTSDHGVKKMTGGVCINEWLIDKGYLTLKEMPDTPTSLSKLEPDWPRTKAWGEGGYYGRLFLNVEDREPEGTIPSTEYDGFRERLFKEIEAIPDEFGNPIGTKVYKPEEIYVKTNNIPPDGIIYFGDLDWRSIGSIGHGTFWIHENDTGPDDANHAQYGLFLVHGEGIKAEERDADIRDIAPTVLRLFDIEPETDFQGSALV